MVYLRQLCGFVFGSQSCFIVLRVCFYVYDVVMA